ncbi:zinc finger FYVE-type containing 26 spastizin [Calliopsis andreniformis]|uniref:zinc finger FYVE-type containing 26 spastizin n=1 Tax=Calliopsis andreniformis TaxID=337506 RepID=UPI003FCEDC86
MSKQMEALEISKCILSKLWYTSLVLHRENISDKFVPCPSDTVDFLESETLITNLLHSQNYSQHQWITELLLQNLINNVASDDKNVRKQHSYVEIIYALQMCKNLTNHLQQGLLMLYENNSEEVFKQIHKEWFIFVKENIYNNPSIICWIINELLSACFEKSTIINAFQDTYFSLVKELLECKSSNQHLVNDNSSGCILCIISNMCIPKYDAAELSKEFFPMLLKIYNLQDIELVLYSRTDKKLFDTWCTFINEEYAHFKIANNLNNALRIQKVLFNCASTSTAVINKNNLIRRIVNMKLHWVIDILDICYILLIKEKYDDVSSIMSCNLLKNFWPVLLLKVLNDCIKEETSYSKTEEADNFLYNSIKFLISNYNCECDFALQKLNVSLKEHVKIVEYIMHWFEKRNETNDTIQIQETSQQKISIKHIFHLLQHFNCLLVLKMTTHLHEQDYNEIKNLLEDLCESENIFYAYCSMLSTVKAILLSDVYNANQTVIANHFSDMKHYLKILYPLSLRVQVIENIFSLLFLQHEDFDHNQKKYDTYNMSTSDEQSKFDNKRTEQHLMGFICNKYIIRDVLFHLKDIMSVTEIECIKMKNENKCTDEIDQIQRNIFSINAAIADAKWRLELYTNSEFTEDVNIAKDMSKCPPAKSEGFLDSKLTLNRFKENILFYQEGNTSSETKVKSDSSSDSDLIYNNTKWRKRSKNIALTLDSTTKDIMHKPLFVNFMLATKENLVVQCLWKNDYAKAENIIQTFGMKNTQLNAEMQFSKALYVFKEDTHKDVNVLRDQNQFTDNLRSPTLENLRQVTQEGIQSSRQTSKLETFLASQETNLRMLSTKSNNSNEILTICVLDLALTMSQIYSISSTLCEVAMKYLKLCKTFDNTEYAHFFVKIYQLLHEKKDLISIENVLCDAKIPFSIKEFKEKEEFWTDIMTKHHEFKESQLNKNTINKILKDGNYLPGLKILSNMTTITSGKDKYMQNVCSHLQLLHTIIPTEEPILMVSDLLRIPLHYYFGYQIFQLKNEPNKLESIAHDLQVNLVYSILTTACPRLSYEKNMRYLINNKDTGCFILNKASCKSDLSYKIQEPNQCVADILTEVLQVLESLSPGQSYLSHSTCKTISKHSKIQDVLSKTSCLINLDLSELSMGDETLTFLLNTWNLMFLHATLTVWANDPPFDDLQHAISLMSIGYLIGDLGLVTLDALRVKLLNNIILDNKFFIQLEELNEPAWQDLDITHDPRVIFMMANEFYGTPCIRVYNTESLNVDLNNAFRDYLDYYTSAFEKSVQNTEIQTAVLLPDMVKQYQNFYSENCKNNANDINNSNKLLSIVDYLKLSNKNVGMQYTTPSYLYDIILKYSNYCNASHQKQINKVKKIRKVLTVRSSLLQYLEGHCWIVSYLLQRIHNENPTILENNCDNLKCTACLENLLCAPWAKETKLLFENNQTFAAILEVMPMHELWSQFDTILKENQWCTCLKLLNALTDNLVVNTELQCFKDRVLSCIVSKEDTILHTNILQYVYQIKDIYVLSQTVLYNINRWHVNICENALLYVVHHTDSYKLPIHCKQQLNEILHRILIFHKMLPFCVTKPNGTWYDVAYCTDKVEPFQIIKSLINADKFELCIEWLESQAFSLEINPSVTQDLLIGLLKNESQNFKQTLKFLHALPLNQSIELCKTVLKKLESTDSLQFICNYLLEHCNTKETIKYKKILIGIDILRMLDARERSLYIHLIKEPLLILEQLLMNCKFESIKKILSRIEDKLEQVDMSRSSFDIIIRFYAQKSLDFRVSLQCDNIENKSRNVQHPALETENTEFVMPIPVPTKSEWIPNDKARECSCCKSVIFSMFNRRHHCRRCGRVICATCSQHRMQVSGYPPSVLVRVCDDCKRQTVLQMNAVQGAPSTPSSELFDYWRLTRDQKHNETIREEFSFEYAPNILLCLAILDLHSDHKTYTSFLLDRCDEMKRLLQPVSGGKVNPEVDHIVIIKMIRSLLIAAKVKCAKLGLNTGLVHCDRFLSQVDLIASLVQSDCLHLIPSDNLKEHTLRKLRDLLIEKEQWTLALDVSTKAGLDTQGVWATWGKACLKMGYFDQARDKFFHCLDKIQNEDSDDWVILSYPKEPASQITRETQKSKTEISKIDETKKAVVDDTSLKSTEFGKNRPLKDPPLLTETLQILDNLRTFKQHVHLYSHQYRSDASQEILNNFGNLKITDQGQLKNAFYHESLYYLLTYGSCSSILEFFLKNEEFNKCLTFTLENNLEPDLFFNAIYLYCLKNGSTDKLHEAMKNKDSSLLIWKKYLIYVCHSLERRQYLNILYQLQLFMKDSIRAAMTCIRFYLNEVSNYTDLCARRNLLVDAQKHLESELQIETLNRKRKKSTSSIHSNQGILTMEMDPAEIDKHVNTICRQMEIAKFLGNCEKEGRDPIKFLNLFPDKDSDNSSTLELPTLFGNQQQKIDLAVLAILCGRNIEEGFGVAFRIMQDYNLPQQKIYSLTGHILTIKNNLPAIEQLIKCCHTSGIPNSYVISDYVLTHCVKLLLNPLHSEPELDLKNDIHSLIRLITDVELKINAYIECKQLKNAYLLASKHKRAQDVRKILKEADRLGQSVVKAICMKWLQQVSKV